jgi:eukaryotic-like serine/threonine-protein kinase
VNEAAGSKDATAEGQVIGDRYKILKKLGEGGMGEVYMAEHIHIEKRVALKLLRAEVLSNQEAVARFRQEARSASSIGHENIISIDDFGTLADGRVYMAMEYLAGKPLNDMLKEPGGLGLERALEILIQTGKGLAAAHAKGITHRDMKPENIFVTQRDGRELVKILDFGIAKVAGGSGEASNLTVAGTIFGTPFYMAPEQALSSKMDHRVDVYAMGVILYETFTGSLPFTGETFMGILTQHITTPPQPPSVVAAANGRNCPLELEAVILRAMAKSADERYQSMNELVAAMTEVFRLFVGPRATGMMAAAPLATSQFVPVPSTYMPAYTGGSTSMPGMGTMPPEPAKKSGGMLLPVVLFGFLGLAGGGGAAWYFLLGPGKKQPEVTPQVSINIPPVPERPVDKPAVDKPVVEKPPVDPPPPVEKPVTEKPPVDKPPKDRPIKVVTPPPPVEKKSIDVVVDSYPRGADIFVAGGKVGETPDTVTVKEGSDVSVTLKLDGYHDGSLTLDGSTKKVKKNLKKVRDDSEAGEIKGWGEVTGEEKKDDKDNPDGLE